MRTKINSAVQSTYLSTKFSKTNYFKVSLTQLTNITLFFIGFFASVRSEAQTCPVGSPTASTGYGVTAHGGSAGSANATGTILSSSTTLNSSNSATLNSSGTTLVIDFQKWVAQGSNVTIAWARSGGTPTANVFYSNDSVTFTSLGTLSGSGSSSSVYTNFSVPSGGLRYIQIVRTGGTLFIDGIRRTHTCYHPVDAIKDTRVFLNPGTARGFVGSNDINFDQDTRRFTLANISTSNGSLSFDTFGYYTYIPNTNFDGIDQFSYMVCDAGPDGNINTTGDNSCDTAVVTFRSLFNCDSTRFFIPLPENEAMDFLKDINSSNGDPMQFYTGLSVSSDAIVIYDHWEDGYETDIKSPTQSTTQVWGDGDLTNGVAPGFPTDILDAGKAIILSNSLSTGHSGSTSYDPNGTFSDTALQNTIDYDGKDKIFIGGIAALAKFAWGSVNTVSMSGTAVPNIDKWDTSYTIPIGQNTSGRDNSFELASLSIMSQANNTIIWIDRDANGTIDITDTLDEGETRYVDSRFGSSFVTVNEGGTVRASKPVMVTLLTGNYSSSYEGRTYSLIPNSQFSTCYYMPGVPQENMRVFLYNPTSSAITVTRTTAGGSTSTINVPANSGNYEDVNNSGLGYRYCANVGFAMITSVDHNAVTSDWGFTPVPTANLTSKVLMSVGAGVDPTHANYGTLNYSQALVTVDSATYLYVDVDGDAMPDNVSFNSDIDATDATVSIGGINYNETTSSNGIALAAFQTITIGSTNGNLNGATFWTKTAANNGGSEGANIILIWGQNGGSAGSPNIDAGYTVPNIEPFISNSVIIRSSDSICLGSNLDSITVKYSGVSPYRIFWYNENTGSYETKSTAADSFVIHNLEPGSYLIKLKDAVCNSFTQRAVIYERTSGCFLDVTGTVYNDSNGLTNSIIDGLGIGQASGTPIYMYLVNNLGIVIDSSVLNPDGTYSLTGVRFSMYTLRMSTTSVGIGDPAPTASLPSNWVNTGEQYGTGNTAGTGIESGVSNGDITVTILTSSISNVNFGIERPPVNSNQSFTITSPSKFLNDTMVLNRSGSLPSPLSASDAEDGNLGAGNQVIIYTPNQNDLYYDANGDNVLDPGERISDSLIISNFDASKLIARFSTNFATDLIFNYKFMDQAGFYGQAATYEINWATPLPYKLLDFKSTCTNYIRDISWKLSKDNKLEIVLQKSDE
ncbi:MAG: Ig-like domain-containing protein [Bacteroidia bacterium]